MLKLTRVGCVHETLRLIYTIIIVYSIDLFVLGIIIT
jgi:hypothetical protein